MGRAVIDRRGTTLDHGRIIVDEPLDRLWRGHHRDGGEVVIAFKSMAYREDTDALVRYDVPGIAKLAFFGIPDGAPGDVALAEAHPGGITLAGAPALDERQTIALGIDMCATAVAWGERREFLTSGIRPETVYVRDGRYTGTTPRTELLLGRESDHFEAPADGGLSYTADDVGFLIARVMWFAHLREDAYRMPGAMNSLENIWHDKRRPWTGPPALGRILEQVLVVDGRLSVRAFRDALQAL